MTTSRTGAAIAVALLTLTATACASPAPATVHPATAAAAAPGACYARSAGVTVATAGGTAAQCAAWAKTLTRLFPSRLPFTVAASFSGTPVCYAGDAVVYAAGPAWASSAQTACNVMNTVLG